MATLTAVALGPTGTTSAPAAVSSSDVITGGDVANGAILEVKNGSGSSINVTIVDSGKTPAGGATTSSTQAVAAGATKRFKPSSLYADTSGNVTVTYSSITSVTYELYT